MIKIKNFLLTTARKCGMKRYHVAGVIVGTPIFIVITWFVAMFVAIFEK